MPASIMCVCVCVCACARLREIGRSAWKVETGKETEIEDYCCVGKEILEGNLNNIFKVNLRTSEKFSTLVVFLLLYIRELYNISFKHLLGK